MQKKAYSLALFILSMICAFASVPCIEAQNTITLTTKKAVGETIKLMIKAKGPVTVEGASGTFENYKPVNYTLSAQTITIRGDVADLYCDQNQLTSLNVADCPNLSRLYCDQNELTALDVTKNLRLSKLSCWKNQLKTLDIAKNTELTGLWCSQNQLSKLDITTNTKLTRLDCSSNQLTALNVAGNNALTGIRCFDNRLTSLDVSNNKALTTLDLEENQLTTLDLSQNNELSRLYCADNQLKILDVSRNPALIQLHCYQNQLTSLDLSKNTALTDINCSGNQIKGDAMVQLMKTLPPYQAPESPTEYEGLYIIDSQNAKEGNICTQAQVQIAKTKGWKVYDYNGDVDKSQEYAGSDLQTNIITLKTAKAIGEKITLRIIAEGDVKIEGATGKVEADRWITYPITGQSIKLIGDVLSLECPENQLTSLDLSGNTTLKKLDCALNQLSDLNVSKNTTLSMLCCSMNSLDKIDISKNIKLEAIHCVGNRISVLDLSGNPALTLVSCSKNNLSALDLTKNVALATLNCFENQLTTLNLSANPGLTYLNCSQNKLTSLDLSANTSLFEVYCIENQIKGQEMTKLVASLSPYKANENRQQEGLYVIDTQSKNEQNICTQSQVAVARKKGWKIYDFNGGEVKEYAGSEDTSTERVSVPDLTLYPNPAKDFVQINGAKANAQVFLYALDGRRVKISQTYDDGSLLLNLATVSRGTYLLQVGAQMQRIVIE